VYLVAYAFAAAKEASAEAVIAQIRKVTRADGDGATVINAQEWAKGSKAAREGKDIDYNGASGPADLDENGDTSRGFFVYWSIKADGDEAKLSAGKAIPFP
jgi:hypothetical protein